MASLTIDEKEVQSFRSGRLDRIGIVCPLKHNLSIFLTCV